MADQSASAPAVEISQLVALHRSWFIAEGTEQGPARSRLAD